MKNRTDILGKKSTVRKLWIGLYCLLIASLLVEVFFDVEPHFVIDGTFGFSAWFGFIACVIMVLLAKILGWLIKRNDEYYHD